MTSRARGGGASSALSRAAPSDADAARRLVHDFWNEASCGEAALLRGADAEAYAAQRAERHRLEPYIPAFASFEQCRGLTVLEIGVGLGADHECFAAAQATLYGIDLTRRAIEHTRARLAQAGLTSNLRVADAEALPFADGHFDLVYSWGALHHTPNTQQALDEVWRVLRPGGTAKLMLYHAPSVVGLMLWTRYALLRGTPWRSLASVYAEHLESPGTQAFTVEQARAMCAQFESVSITTVLTHGDLLTSGAGARHDGVLLRTARRVWPRRLIRRWFPRSGLFMLITATKPPL